MKRMLLALAVLSVASVTSSAYAQAPSPFSFVVPQGFVNLSTGQPEGNWAGINPQVKQMVQGGNFAFYAADKAGMGDGFMENVNVTLAASPGPITDESLRTFASQMDGELKKATNGTGGYTPVSWKVVQIGGVTSGRLVGLTRLPGVVTKQIAYIVPSGPTTAIITYSTTEKAFAKYERIFDAAAQATKGAKPQ